MITNLKHLKNAFAAWKVAPANEKGQIKLKEKKIKRKQEIGDSKQELMQSIDLKSVMFDQHHPSIKKVQKSLSPKRLEIPNKKANDIKL